MSRKIQIEQVFVNLPSSNVKSYPAKLKQVNKKIGVGKIKNTVLLLKEKNSLQSSD